MAWVTIEANVDMRKFETEMRKMLRMDTRLSVEERNVRLQYLLIIHVADNNLEGVV